MEHMKGELVKKDPWELRYMCKECGNIVFFTSRGSEEGFGDRQVTCSKCGSLGTLLQVHKRISYQTSYWKNPIRKHWWQFWIDRYIITAEYQEKKPR